MAHAAPTLQWSLDSTASTTVSVAKDVIRAATSDNVQALALIACEKFGATLAMCLETNKKMEDLIIKVSGPKIVRFMGAQIGYSANDCATQLSRSLAGVQFLGLAAALVSSAGAFQGADALSVMLMASASDKTLLPTARQLKDLLKVIEHRVNRSGFTDLWAGYQILVHSGLCAFYESTHHPTGESRKQPNQLRDFMQIPEPDGVSKMIEAFRELNRLGEATSITIQATSCAPWVMAFTRWCLGIPPSTLLPDGQALLDQPASRVTLFTSRAVNAATFEIAVQRSIGSPADLLKFGTSTQNPPSMVTIEWFGRMMCQNMGGETSEAYRAMCQALPYALNQCCRLLRLIEIVIGEKPQLQRSQRRRPSFKFDEHLKEYDTQAFPQESVICNILTKLLNSNNQQHLKHLTESHMISDLPLVQLHLRRLAQNCTCRECNPERRMPKTINLDIWECPKEEFFYKLSLSTADILALSLFQNPDTLLVHFDPANRGSRKKNVVCDSVGYVSAIYSIIKSGKSKACAVTKVLAWALGLVGHSTGDVEGERWVISCSQGQAVYPRVFETEKICQSGYLVLCWAPGLLVFDGETYDRGLGLGDTYNDNKHIEVTTPSSRPVTGPLNLAPNMRMVWKVRRHDGYLEVFPVCGHHRGHAFNILFNLTRSLVLTGCPHDSAMPLKSPDKFAKYGGPIHPGEDADPYVSKSRRPDPGRLVTVVAVDGDAGLQTFAMSSSFRPPLLGLPDIVLRNDSCLQCCLDLCEEASAPLLIC